MGAYTGTAVTLELMTNATTTDLAFTAMTNDLAFDASVDSAEVTPLGTTHKAFVPSTASAEVSFKVFYDDTYTGSVAAKVLGTLGPVSGTVPPTKLWRVRPQGSGTGKLERTFNGFVTGISEMLANSGDAVGADVTIQVTGVWTNASQS